MPLFVSYRRGSYCCEKSLDWLPIPYVAELFIAVDFERVPENWLPSGTTGFASEWDGHNFFFRVPKGVRCVNQVRNWRSHSSGSGALYPWWWNLRDQYSGCLDDVILQILPGPGITSYHYHQWTLFEEYVPLDNVGGKTKIVVSNEPPRPLIAQTIVRIGESHRLIREENGFSVHLLRMRGPIRFPDRSDHVPVRNYVNVR